MTYNRLRWIWVWAFIILGALGILVLTKGMAEAAHCRQGQLYRPSMHRCVSERSNAGREVRAFQRYVRLEQREERRARRKLPPSIRHGRMADRKGEGWFANIFLPDDGSLDEAPPVGSKPKEVSPGFAPWPRDWDTWPPKFDKFDIPK
jgi:hypothetical protein